MRRAMFITVALLCLFWAEAVLAQPALRRSAAPFHQPQGSLSEKAVEAMYERTCHVNALR